MNKDSVVKIRDEILLELLPDVAFDGWCWDAVIDAARRCGIDGETVRVVFPGKMPDVLDAFADIADRKMLEAVEPEVGSVRERVASALMARYRFLVPYKEAVRQSAQFWAVPQHKMRGVKLVWRTADRIWCYAGDTATDYNRYTKRIFLSGIIISSTLFWFNINDVEESLDSLRTFIDRRIENVQKIGRIVKKVKRAS